MPAAGKTRWRLPSLGTRIIRLAGRPAKIVQDYPNDLPFPRDPSDAKAFAEKMIDDAKRFA